MLRDALLFIALRPIAVTSISQTDFSFQLLSHFPTA